MISNLGAPTGSFVDFGVLDKYFGYAIIKIVLLLNIKIPKGGAPER
jgi:hypothetical protein